MKQTSIAILILTFLAFLFYQIQRTSDFQVLEVISPAQIVIDINKNGIEDDNETVFLKNIQTFSTRPSKEQSELAQKLKISKEDALGLGFLAQNFAKEALEGKKIKISVAPELKTSSRNINAKIRGLTNLRCRIMNNCIKNSGSLFRQDVLIFIDNKNYEDLIVNKGLALNHGEPPSAYFFKNLEKVQKLNLVIFNNKSHKYHKLSCKYGLLAHNSQIIPLMQLPKDAKACKFCFSKKQSAKCKIRNVFYFHDDTIPDIKSPATVFEGANIKLFLTDFTRILKPSNNCETLVCRSLVQEINSAQSTIDFAIYGYTKVPKIQKALQNAQLRGVKIRFVYDLDKNKTNIYPHTDYLTSILTNNRSDLTNAIMHDKFFIFDGKKVLTGSANISNTDMSGFNSNAIMLINSEKIANVYKQEFEQMYQGKFHNKKRKICDKQDDDFSIYFSPKDNAITNEIIPLVDGSKKYIYIPAFLITHKELTQSLINASKRGVAVKLILDTTNTHSPSSKLKMLRQNGIQVKTENFAGKLHSKSIIIDDLYTVIGSTNFSRSGECANDENLVIIKNREIAMFYKTFFQYLWKRIPDKWLKLNARAESPDSIGSCSDGIDNDFDGKTDFLDDSCTPLKTKKK